MSKEELLKYLIAEIDLIMHDKDYRFENANGTWYSRESCRDLTNEEVFEELRTELRQFADLEAKLAESEKNYKDARELGIEQFHSLKEIINSSQEEIDKLKQQLADKEQENERLKEEICRYEITLMDKNSQLKKRHQDKISFAIAELEKVKGLIANHTQELWTCENDDIDVVLYEEIDKQINELKGKV